MKQEIETGKEVEKDLAVEKENKTICIVIILVIKDMGITLVRGDYIMDLVSEIPQWKTVGDRTKV